MSKRKRKPRTRLKKRWQQLEDLFGTEAIELVEKRLIIKLLGEKERFRDMIKTEHHQGEIKRSRHKPIRRIFGKGRPPLPEGVLVREKHKSDIGVGRHLLPGTEIDIFFSHHENKDQECHTHTIIYDDEGAVPKNLLIYDRGLNRNRFLIAPGKKCKQLREGEEAEVGVFEIPDPETNLRASVEEDRSLGAQRLREDIEFEADQELLEWRGDENPFPEYEGDTWKNMIEAENRLMAEAYSEYIAERMRPHPDFNEP